MYTLLQRFALVLLFAPNFAFALIDMRNANYSDTWVDMQVKGTAYDLRIQRAYNSRTLFSGIFGFGWCSEFETTLKITAENTLRVTECGAGFEIEYTPLNHNSKNLEKNIASIMAEVRKRNKGKDNQFFQNLEKDLRLDTELRDEFAKELNLSGKIAANARYVANGRSTDFIIFKGEEYLRNLPNGTFQKFNKKGQLTQTNDKNGNFIKIAYKADKLFSVSDNAGASIQFKYYDNSKLVKQVTGPGALTASYKYKGENLVEVTNGWKNTYKHEYDDLYNMTKAIYPDNTYIALSYDKDKDWVTSYRDRRGCVESYKYSDNDKDPENNYRSAVEKKCGAKVTNTSSYEFWHKTKGDGTRFLTRSLSVNNGRRVETIYHPEFGRPVELIQDGIISRFEYYPSGLLKKKFEPNINFSYKYENPCGKVSQVAVRATVPGAPTGKDRKPTKVETRTQITDFLYDQKYCNLVSARNSFGQTAVLSYDMRGRITKIIDQSKKEVSITYEERFGKPYVVTRPGLGSIKFKYKADGTMEKFDSNDDPLVAVQVANIFSNLLEIIAPATTDANNI